MIEVNYVDLPGLGASKGVQRWVFDQGLPVRELDAYFVYGTNHATLMANSDRVRARVDLAVEFPDQKAYYDGHTMPQRAIIASIIREPDTAKRLIGVDFYPPYDDEAEQQRLLGEVCTYMELANAADKSEISARLRVLGLGHHLGD